MSHKNATFQTPALVPSPCHIKNYGTYATESFGHTTSRDKGFIIHIDTHLNLKEVHIGITKLHFDLSKPCWVAELSSTWWYRWVCFSRKQQRHFGWGPRNKRLKVRVSCLNPETHRLQYAHSSNIIYTAVSDPLTSGGWTHKNIGKVNILLRKHTAIHMHCNGLAATVCTVLLKKLTVTQLVKKFIPWYETWSRITVFTR